jgi:hypothetical protein
MNNLLALMGETDSEKNAHLIAWFLLALGILTLYRTIRWLCSGPALPEPWSPEIAAEMDREDARPLCYHCLEPHDRDANFCPDCGGPVGRYTNWLPYPYLFSIGHLLRTGTSGEFKRTPITITGFFLFSLVEYAFFAPIYWIQFLIGLAHRRPLPPAAPPGEPPPQPAPPEA